MGDESGFSAVFGTGRAWAEVDVSCLLGLDFLLLATLPFRSLSPRAVKDPVREEPSGGAIGCCTAVPVSDFRSDTEDEREGREFRILVSASSLVGGCNSAISIG